MNRIKLKNLLEQAVLTVLSRGGDFESEDGISATVGTDEVIRLECAIADAFGLDSDDCSESDVPTIKAILDNLALE